MKRPFLRLAIVAVTLVAAALAYFAFNRSASARAIFTAQDNEESAYWKIEAFSPFDAKNRAQGTVGNAVRDLLLACRDYCQRFPESPYYANVRLTAVQMSTLSPHGISSPELGGWDPATAEHDPRLDGEQRSQVAFLLATARARRSTTTELAFADASFDEVVAVLPPHRDTMFARDTLIRHALGVEPAKAIARLREFYPNDEKVAASIRLLQNIGQRCVLVFSALDGRRVDSRDYRGKVVMLDFWAKGCGPCLEGFPEMKRLQDLHAARGFAIIGVNLDTERADAEEIVKKFELPWPAHFDGKGWDNELAERFAVRSIPQAVLIDRQGVLRFVGQFPGSPETTKRIEALLAEQ